MAIRIGAAAVALTIGMGLAASAQEVPALVKAGPEHKILAKELGTWDAEVTMFMPGTDAAKSKGVETNTLLGDRWLISEFKGEVMGMPFEGHGQFGYDASKKKYVGTWVDSWSVSIDALEGAYDEKTHTMTLRGDVLDPSSGKAMKVRMETVQKSDTERVFTQFVQADGEKDFTKAMEIVYKKRAK